MYALSLILIFSSLLVIAWQDHRARSVTWILFPLLAAGGLLLNSAGAPPLLLLLQNTGINVLFLMLQLALLQGWFWLRGWKLSAAIGWGDIVFLLAAAFFFSPVNFIGFYISSLLLIVVFWLVRTSIVSGDQKTIPLAGLQALCLLLLVIFSWSTSYSLQNDGWLFKIIHL